MHFAPTLRITSMKFRLLILLILVTATANVRVPLMKLETASVVLAAYRKVQMEVLSLSY